MMKKYFIILIVFLSMILTACSSIVTEKEPQDQIFSDTLSGYMTEIPQVNADGIPYCKPYYPKPLQTWDIINIDDVVEDCSYKTGNIVYIPFGYGSNFPAILNIRENLVSVDWDAWENMAMCDTHWHLEYSVPSRFNNALLFVEKYFAKWGQPFDNMYAETFEREDFVSVIYHCKEEYLCQKLENLPFGENEKHYFYYASRALDHEEGFRDYLKIDEKVYFPWEHINLDYENSSLVQQSMRMVNALIPDKLIVSRYTNWELIEPYKSNPELIDTDENDRKVRNNKDVIIGTFQIQTCKIPL